MNCLPDINIWLALTFSAHPHHASASRWFDKLMPGTASFCRMTQQGFLRLSSNPKVFKSDALSLSLAWAAYDTLMSDGRVTFEPESVGTDREWRTYTDDENFSAKIWNDAYLAAFAKTAGLELVTFDRGFRRYDGLKLRLLAP